MWELACALLVFVALHSLPALPRWRGMLIRRLGFGLYSALYSLLSLLALGAVIVTYRAAPWVPLWGAMPLLTLAVMLPACLLLVAGAITPNPLSLTLRRGSFDPAAPGVLALTRHPLLHALALWSLGHTLGLGHGAAVLTFGTFALLALLGPLAVEAKRKRRLGEEEWQRLSAKTSAVPLVALLTGRAPWRLGRTGLGVLGLGVALYGLLVLLHGPVMGRPLLPFFSMMTEVLQ